MKSRLAIASATLMLAAGAAACSVPQKGDFTETQSAYAPPPAYAPPAYAPPHDDELDGAPAYAAPSHAVAPARAAADCAIRVRRTSAGVDITPVATPGRAMSGDYDLVITKSGASGSSDVTQAGPFRARAGETVTLGQTELSLGRRDRYRAVLVLTEGRREICRREVRS
jgi:hypothetical protein